MWEGRWEHEYHLKPAIIIKCSVYNGWTICRFQSMVWLVCGTARGLKLFLLQRDFYERTDCIGCGEESFLYVLVVRGCNGVCSPPISLTISVLFFTICWPWWSFPTVVISKHLWPKRLNASEMLRPTPPSDVCSEPE